MGRIKMTLDRIVKQKKKFIRRVPSDDVLDQVQKGRQFIPVDDEFDTQIEGYTQLKRTYKGDAFNVLVPHELLFYVANEGEGNADEALDVLADFYSEAGDYEDDMIEDGNTSVQEANLATAARSSYKTFLVNKLVKHKIWAKDEDGEPVADFDAKTLKDLDLNDSYVEERVKAMAALALGKNAEEVKTYGVGNLLKHVTVIENKTEVLTKEEFKRVACYTGSHYELKEKYQNDPDVKYDISRSFSSGSTKTIRKRGIVVFDSEINGLEQEILEYRMKKHGEVGRHDAALIRTFANLAHIAEENPNAQLDIMPAKKEK